MRQRQALAVGILGALVFLVPNYQSLQGFVAPTLIIGAALSALAMYASVEIDKPPAEAGKTEASESKKDQLQNSTQSS